MADDLLAATFRFRVGLTVGGAALAGDGAFQECSGLEIELDVSEYPEGGRNDGVVQRVGRAKFPRLVLKRGMFHPAGGRINADLWTWIQEVAGGQLPLRRCDGRVEVLGGDRSPVAVWEFRRGLPARVSGPQLNARTGEVAIEELQIAHESLRLVTS